jgi:hypothetical protein
VNRPDKRIQGRLREISFRFPARRRRYDGQFLAARAVFDIFAVNKNRAARSGKRALTP